MVFLREFLDDCVRWERILRGVLANMQLLTAARMTGGDQQLSLTQEDLDNMEQYLQHVRSHLLRRSQ